MCTEVSQVLDISEIEVFRREKLKMFKFMCLLALYMASVNSLCVRENRETVLCRNEFMFRQLFRTATNVDLIDSFMAARNVQMFPRLKIVRVAGLYAAETCKALSSTDIKLYGCEGNYANYRRIYNALDIA